MTTLVLVIALTFAIIVTPLVRQLALRLNFVAVPRQDRAHQSVTPLMGGVALYLGLTASIIVLSVVVWALSDASELVYDWPFEELYIVLFCGTVIAGVGLWDDWAQLAPGWKLVMQLLPVAILMFTTSVRIEMRIPPIMNYTLTACWFMYIINAVNYLDNMDGVAAMEATLAGLFFAVIAVINEQPLVAALAAAVAGTSFGFLRYNLFEPAKSIFMGDVGSLFLGFLLAVIGVKLEFAAESPWITWPVPVLVLGVPIFDTGLVFVSRTRRGQSFLQGGTDHLSHRLARLGFGRLGVPLAIGLLTAVLSSTAIMVMHSSFENSLMAQLTIAGVALYLLYNIEFARSREFITGLPSEERSESSR